MFTREQREARMMAAWEAHLAKFLTPRIMKEACFMAFMAGWVGGHELGAEEVTEIAKAKLVELTEAALKRSGGA